MRILTKVKELGESHFFKLLSSSLTGKSFEAYKRNAGELKKLWEAYISNPVLFGGINAIALKCIGKGYRIVSEDEKLKEYIETKLKDLRISSKLFFMIRDALVFGDSIAEKSIKNGDIKGIKILNPVNWEAEINQRTGEITHYYNEKPLARERVFHLNFYPNYDSPYGIPLTKVVYNSAHAAIQIDDAICKAILRHGTTKWQVKIKPDARGRYPSKERMEEITSDISDVNTRQTMVTTDLMEVIPLDTQGVPNIQNYNEYLTNIISTGLGVPIEALGQATRGSTHATAKARLDMFLTSISFYQEMIEKILPFEILTTDEVREALGYPELKSTGEVEEKSLEEEDRDIEEKAEVDVDFPEDFKSFQKRWEKARKEILEEVEEYLREKTE